ncbi:MAG: hypothetical protein DRO11_00760 [Methanobacteriota archaeon]|nr:MAG: hypothetical protein DRO11_00760 [Euryarchaeota archaeon]
MANKKLVMGLLSLATISILLMIHFTEAITYENGERLHIANMVCRNLRTKKILEPWDQVRPGDRIRCDITVENRTNGLFEHKLLELAIVPAKDIAHLTAENAQFSAGNPWNYENYSGTFFTIYPEQTLLIGNDLIVKVPKPGERFYKETMYLRAAIYEGYTKDVGIENQIVYDVLYLGNHETPVGVHVKPKTIAEKIGKEWSLIAILGAVLIGLSLIAVIRWWQDKPVIPGGIMGALLPGLAGIFVISIAILTPTATTEVIEAKPQMIMPADVTSFMPEVIIQTICCGSQDNCTNPESRSARCPSTWTNPGASFTVEAPKLLSEEYKPTEAKYISQWSSKFKASVDNSIIGKELEYWSVTLEVKPGGTQVEVLKSCNISWIERSVEQSPGSYKPIGDTSLTPNNTVKIEFENSQDDSWVTGKLKFAVLSPERATIGPWEPGELNLEIDYKDVLVVAGILICVWLIIGFIISSAKKRR